LASISLSPGTVLGGSSSTGTVTLGSIAGPSGIVVALSSNSSSASPPASVTVPAGLATATFQVPTTAVASSTVATITGALNGVNQSSSLTITPPSLTGVSLSPNSVTGGSTSTGAVTLSGPAPSAGTVVTLSSNNAAYASVPASVTVQGGSTTGTFTVNTSPDQSAKTATITGTLGSTSKTAAITINPPALLSFTISPSTVNGGSKATGTIMLSGPAAAGGVGITLSSNSSNATVQSNITVPAGATSVTVVIATTDVTTTTTATISASHGSVSVPATLTIQ